MREKLLWVSVVSIHFLKSHYPHMLPISSAQGVIFLLQFFSHLSFHSYHYEWKNWGVENRVSMYFLKEVETERIYELKKLMPRTYEQDIRWGEEPKQLPWGVGKRDMTPPCSKINLTKPRKFYSISSHGTVISFLDKKRICICCFKSYLQDSALGNSLYSHSLIQRSHSQTLHTALLACLCSSYREYFLNSNRTL